MDTHFSLFGFSVSFHSFVICGIGLSHAPGILIHMNSATVKQPVTNRMHLVVPTLPTPEASSEQLQEWIRETFRVRNQAAAARAEYLAELRRREGSGLTETVLREGGLLAPRRARQEMETAAELEKLPKTREGLRKGDISPDNARILAAANQRGPIDEEELVDRAKSQSPDKFAGTVRRHERARAEDDGVKRLEHQQKQRFAKIKTSLDDGMTVLYGRFDPITGAKIKTVLSHTMNQLWHEEDPQQRVTPGQRMADALEILLTRPDRKKKARYQGVRLLLMADYDTVSQQLHNGRLVDGTPVPARTLRRLACDAQILPAIFSGGSQPLDLGMARRAANTAQRAALVARDKHCIGCGAQADWCQAHHIVHWQHGGPTNLDNLCLLCSRCHHRVHDQDWQVHKTSTGVYTLQPPPRNHNGRRSTTKRQVHRRRPAIIKQRK